MVPNPLKACLLLPLILTACAHAHYYRPKADNEESIFLIPNTGPTELTLSVKSLGIDRKYTVPMLRMQLSITTESSASDDHPDSKKYIDPTEQTVRIENGQRAFRPAYVHSKTPNHSMIELGTSEKEVIEFLYPVPEAEEKVGITSFAFQWTVHYGSGKTEQQITHFIRYEVALKKPTNLYPHDLAYPFDDPFDITPLNKRGYRIFRDPFWWVLDPWWPWW